MKAKMIRQLVFLNTSFEEQAFLSTYMLHYITYTLLWTLDRYGHDNWWILNCNGAQSLNIITSKCIWADLTIWITEKWVTLYKWKYKWL